MKYASMKYASIDVGTNTVLLLIVEKGDQMVDILDISSVTRLGQGLGGRGHLSDEAMARTFSALERYKKIIQENDVREVMCVGTSALREAGNSEAFLKMIREKLEIPVRIISERDEAYYTYLSIKNDELFGGDNFIIVDIGGGSTEVIKGNNREFLDYVSLPAGTVKLTEMFVKHDPPLGEELSGLADYVKGLFKFPFDGSGGLFIGTGGTITNLASIVLGLEAYEKDKVHNLKVTLNEIHTLIDAMKGMNTSERRTIKGMEEGREDIMLQGIIFLREMMVYFGKRNLIVSVKGVRYGVVYERFRGCD